MSDAISETVSKKRGRPKAFRDETISLHKSLFPDRKYRSHQNAAYRSRAIRALEGQRGVEWILDVEAVDRGDGDGMRMTILAELGRVEHLETIVELARRICELKPKSKAAVRMLRQWRIGKTKPGDALELANRIIATCNEYLQAHPSMEWADVLSAIDTAADQVSKARQKKPP